MSRPQHGYRIDTIGGVMARWLPTIDAAKERYLAAVRESDFDLPPTEVRFEESTEGEDGESLPPYLRCLEDGRWQASISPERPAWPTSEFSRGDGPVLAMSAHAPMLLGCAHAELTCSGTARPEIRCAVCGQAWTPQ